MDNINVFEDLIGELRDENLLEETVIDLSKTAHTSIRASRASTAGDEAGLEDSGPSGPDAEREFFRKRAIDEISSLQMVEHVLSGIEREHMKAISASYDDLRAKKALHSFLQVQGEPGTTEYAEAEGQLMHETEAWCSALANRDKDISAASLRRFCENSRPALSSQALMALGRFYRNAAYTELSRAKFDLVMTRLFSREIDGARRRLLFSREDMVGHLRTLYANWSSVALYSTDEASLKTRAVVAGFEDRIREVESAETFDQIIRSTFLDKVHEFKEATGEMFFTPEIVSAVIECNVRIGNKFVDLIHLERERSNAATIEQRYGYEYDQIISEAAGKTLQLVELLKNLPESDLAKNTHPPPTTVVSVPASDVEKPGRTQSDLFKVNKWLLATTILVVLASVGLYFWSSQASVETSVTQSARDVDLANSGVDEYLRSGRASKETFYAITLPAWEQLSDEQKRAVVQKTAEFAGQQKLRRVKLVNVRGDTEAFASGERLDIYSTAP
ncbi:MAG TPA: hypothetical protein VFZ23_08945 [Pyrinomonadaceae bacterium]